MLSHFAPKIIKIEVDRVDRFIGCLKMKLRGFVRAFRPTTQVDALC